MSDTKADIKIIVDGREYVLTDEGLVKLQKECCTKKDFGGTTYSDQEYGAVEVKLRPEPKQELKTYTVIVGNLEWWKAEDQFKVKGIRAIKAALEGERNMTEFYRIALERSHKGITSEQVAKLRDYKPADGGPRLRDAVERAMSFSKPHEFPDEEVDPKVLQAIVAAMAVVATNLPESTATT